MLQAEAMRALVPTSGPMLCRDQVNVMKVCFIVMDVGVKKAEVFVLEKQLKPSLW